MTDSTATQKKWLTNIMNMLEEHLGAEVEIVMQNLTLDYEHTIVDIRNGHITGQKVGDSAGRSIGIEAYRGKVKHGDRYNYVTHTRDAKILRSSTTFLCNEDGVAVASLTIHTDITKTVQFECSLHAYNNISTPTADAGSMGSVLKLLEQTLLDSTQLVGKPVSQMTKEDKTLFIKYMDEAGTFLITKSGDRICEYLGISRFSLYHYLDSARNMKLPQSNAAESHNPRSINEIEA